jgi:hypothetical protein
MNEASEKPRIRSLMVAILVVALLGAGRLYASRRAEFARLADHHLGEMASMVNASRTTGYQADIVEGKAPHDTISRFLNPVANTRNLRESEALFARRADYHAALGMKYREAADRPWAAIEPDPPAP